jgi:hypothetical protein
MRLTHKDKLNRPNACQLLLSTVEPKTVIHKHESDDNDSVETAISPQVIEERHLINHTNESYATSKKNESSNGWLWFVAVIVFVIGLFIAGRYFFKQEKQVSDFTTKELSVVIQDSSVSQNAPSQNESVDGEAPNVVANTEINYTFDNSDRSWERDFSGHGINAEIGCGWLSLRPIDNNGGSYFKTVDFDFNKNWILQVKMSYGATEENGNAIFYGGKENKNFHMLRLGGWTMTADGYLNECYIQFMDWGTRLHANSMAEFDPTMCEFTIEKKGKNMRLYIDGREVIFNEEVMFLKSYGNQIGFKVDQGSYIGIDYIRLKYTD